MKPPSSIDIGFFINDEAMVTYSYQIIKTGKAPAHGIN
jgi:hypothetical protein